MYFVDWCWICVFYLQFACGDSWVGGKASVILLYIYTSLHTNLSAYVSCRFTVHIRIYCLADSKVVQLIRFKKCVEMCEKCIKMDEKCKCVCFFLVFMCAYYGLTIENS